MHLQQASFPRCSSLGAERKTNSVYVSIPANLGFHHTPCIEGALRVRCSSNPERLQSPGIGKSTLRGTPTSSSCFHPQRRTRTFAAGLSAGSGDGQGGNTGNGHGGGGGSGGQPPFGGGPSDDGRRRFDLEECLLYSGAVVAVALGLWTSHNRQCRAVLWFLRWASGNLKKEPRGSSASRDFRAEAWDIGKDALEHLQGVVQSALLLLSSLDIREQIFGGSDSEAPSEDDRAEVGNVSKLALEHFQGVVQSALSHLSSLDIREKIFGGSDSDASTSEEAPFPLSAFAALSLPFPFAALTLPFLSIFHQNPIAEEEAPPKVTEVWEVQGDSWTRLVPGGSDEDEWVLDGHFSGRPAEKPSEEAASASTSGKEEVSSSGRHLKERAREAADRVVSRLKQTLLPESYPHSVTEDYAEYSGWRLGQIVASQVKCSVRDSLPEGR